MNPLQWFREWREEPSQKCLRVGHDRAWQTQTGYRKPDDNDVTFRTTVFYRSVRGKPACRRCKATFGSWEILDRGEGVNEWTAPDHYHQSVETHGFYAVTFGWQPVGEEGFVVPTKL